MFLQRLELLKIISSYIQNFYLSFHSDVSKCFGLTHIDTRL